VVEETKLLGVFHTLWDRCFRNQNGLSGVRDMNCPLRTLPSHWRLAITDWACVPGPALCWLRILR